KIGRTTLPLRRIPIRAAAPQDRPAAAECGHSGAAIAIPANNLQGSRPKRRQVRGSYVERAFLVGSSCCCVFRRNSGVNVYLEFPTVRSRNYIIEETQRLFRVHPVFVAERLIPTRRDGHQRFFATHGSDPEGWPT